MPDENTVMDWSKNAGKMEHASSLWCHEDISLSHKVCVINAVSTFGAVQFNRKSYP